MSQRTLYFLERSKWVFCCSRLYFLTSLMINVRTNSLTFTSLSYAIFSRTSFTLGSIRNSILSVLFSFKISRPFGLKKSYLAKIVLSGIVGNSPYALVDIFRMYDWYSSFCMSGTAIFSYLITRSPLAEFLAAVLFLLQSG